MSCCVAFGIASFATLPALAMRSAKVNGDENIVVSDTSGNVSIKIDKSSTITTNTFVYNTKSGLSEQEVLDMTKAVAQQTQDRSKVFFGSLSQRLDILGKKLSQQIARTTEAQAKLASAQGDLEQLELNNGERIDEARLQVTILRQEVAQAEKARELAAAQQINDIASATAAKVVASLHQAQQLEAEAARQHRLSLSNLLTFGFEFSGSAHSNHELVEFDFRHAIWPDTSDWALEIGLRALLGSQALSNRYVDGAGTTLNEPPAAHQFSYGLQAEVGVRGLRSSSLGIPIAVGWRAWSAGGLGHWAAVGEAGLEYRDFFTIGGAAMATFELEGAQLERQYTGVGAASRILPRAHEVLFGGRLYVGGAF